MPEDGGSLTPSRCTQADFVQVLTDLSDFWGSDRTRALHHPMFLHEFGDTSLVVRDGERVVAYLFGLLSQTEPVGYIHLVGVRAEYRRRGIARELYRRFAELAARQGCRELKAITTPANPESIAFHASLGMLPAGVSRGGRTPIMEDYAGPGEARVVLRGAIEGAL